MKAHVSWLRVGTVLLTVAVSAAGTPDVAVAHEKGVLKPATRQLVPGSFVRVDGEKFSRGSRLTLVLIGVDGDHRLREIQVDTAGGFVESLEVPDDLAQGAYRLVALASDGDEAATVDVEVLAAVDPRGTEPASGSEHVPSAIPLTLDRSESPLVTGGAVVGILLAFAIGATMLRRPKLSV
jgi:hypothetical protein